MATLLDIHNNKSHITSISFPSKSHPSTSEIEQKIMTLSHSIQFRLVYMDF